MFFFTSPVSEEKDLGAWIILKNSRRTLDRREKTYVALRINNQCVIRPAAFLELLQK